MPHPQLNAPTLLTPVELTMKIDRLCQILSYENELLALRNTSAMTEHQADLLAQIEKE